MATRSRGLRLRILSAAATVILAGCGSAPSEPSRSPAVPFFLAPGANAGVASVTATTVADVGACLGRTAGAHCFNAAGVQPADVTSSPLASAPLNLTSVVSGSTVSLVWTQPTFLDAPVTSYVVEAGSIPGFAAPDLANFDTGNVSTSLIASNVPPGIYYVRVRARNALGLSGPSNEIQVVVAGAGGSCPGAPRSLTTTLPAPGTVSLSWLAPLSGRVQSYVIQAGSSPGLSNLADFDTRNIALTYLASAVPPGSYYVRVRAQAGGCPLSQPSNEVLLVVPGASVPTGPNPLVTFALTYTCNPCNNDPDNYALNIDCTAGRCSIFRTSTPLRSPNTITASLRLAPGVRNIEVVVRNASGPWTLTVGSGSQPNTGGVVPASFVLVDPPGGNLSVGRCSVSSRLTEPFLEFRVVLGAPGSVC